MLAVVSFVVCLFGTTCRAANSTRNSAEEECGFNTFRKIVGGTEVKNEMWPWMAQLLYLKNDGLFCGSVIISEDYVLTAAHCTDGQNASDILVRVGEIDFRKSKSDHHKDIQVEVIKQHPDFNSDTMWNDISLLKLRTPITFGEDTQPICLPKAGQNYVGQNGTIAGWGAIKYDSETSPDLRETQVPIWKNSDCYETVKENFADMFPENLPEIFVCAGGTQTPRDTCQGDSGGPLMLEDHHHQWSVIGIVSFGIGCAIPGHPGLYTRVNHYLPFIRNSIK